MGAGVRVEKESCWRGRGTFWSRWRVVQGKRLSILCIGGGVRERNLNGHCVHENKPISKRVKNCA